jgi:hypothetical protein
MTEKNSSEGVNFAGWRVGVGRVRITPEKPTWQGGYASRTHVMEGVLQDIWAKALALEDRDGRVGVIVTMDVCHLPRSVALELKGRLARECGLSREQVILNVSHSHSGPIVGYSPWSIHPLSAAEWEDVYAYTRQLVDKVVAVVVEALARRVPATISTGGGTVYFAVNRRRNVEKDLTPMVTPVGPVDHAVPVMKVEGARGETIAVLFGYACHNTVLDGYFVCGDYAGYAQEEVERLHPGATALFFQGAGADQNPLPRRKVSYAVQYGRELAAAVEQTLADGMTPCNGVLEMRYAEIPLGLEEPMSVERLSEIAREDGYRGWCARALLEERARGVEPLREYPYPVQFWRVGGQKVFALGGEIVCGYSHAIKNRHGADAFVMGYSNDVMSYMPMPEMWAEGGYEIEDANLCYGLPAPWKRDVTARILDAVDRLAAGYDADNQTEKGR